LACRKAATPSAASAARFCTCTKLCNLSAKQLLLKQLHWNSNKSHFRAEVGLITELPALDGLVQVPSETGLELQAEVLRRVCHADELHHAMYSARGN
jgi:hypothetical protein